MFAMENPIKGQPIWKVALAAVVGLLAGAFIWGVIAGKLATSSSPS
jgi:hypothetical protein